MFKELGTMMSLLGNKGKLQEEVGKFQQFVAQLTADGTAGAGMVTVKVTGKMEVASVKISDEAMRLNDREMLEDLITAATNQALGKVREQLSAEANKMAASLGLPAGMLGGLGGSIPGLG